MMAFRDLRADGAYGLSTEGISGCVTGAPRCRWGRFLRQAAAASTQYGEATPYHALGRPDPERPILRVAVIPRRQL